MLKYNIGDNIVDSDGKRSIITGLKTKDESLGVHRNGYVIKKIDGTHSSYSAKTVEDKYTKVDNLISNSTYGSYELTIDNIRLTNERIDKIAELGDTEKARELYLNQIEQLEKLTKEADNLHKEMIDALPEKEKSELLNYRDKHGANIDKNIKIKEDIIKNNPELNKQTNTKKTNTKQTKNVHKNNKTSNRKNKYSKTKSKVLDDPVTTNPAKKKAFQRADDLAKKWTKNTEWATYGLIGAGAIIAGSTILDMVNSKQERIREHKQLNKQEENLENQIERSSGYQKKAYIPEQYDGLVQKLFNDRIGHSNTWGGRRY